LLFVSQVNPTSDTAIRFPFIALACLSFLGFFYSARNVRSSAAVRERLRKIADRLQLPEPLPKEPPFDEQFAAWIDIPSAGAVESGFLDALFGATSWCERLQLWRWPIRAWYMLVYALEVGFFVFAAVKAPSLGWFVTCP